MHVGGGTAIALAKAFPRAIAQERVHGLACRNGIERKLVAEVVEREFESRREFERVGNGLWKVGEELLHLLR